MRLALHQMFRELRLAVDHVGAHPLLTDAVVLLTDAEGKITEYETSIYPRAGATPALAPTRAPAPPTKSFPRHDSEAQGPNSGFDSRDGGQDWSIAESPKDALLSFIDAGAAGDEPVKGVMQCHILEWFDEIEKLCALAIGLNTKLVLAESLLRAADHTLSVHGKIDADTDLHERIRRRVQLTSPECGGQS